MSIVPVSQAEIVGPKRLLLHVAAVHDTGGPDRPGDVEEEAQALVRPGAAAACLPGWQLGGAAVLETDAVIATIMLQAGSGNSKAADDYERSLCMDGTWTKRLSTDTTYWLTAHCMGSRLLQQHVACASPTAVDSMHQQGHFCPPVARHACQITAAVLIHRSPLSFWHTLPAYVCHVLMCYTHHASCVCCR
jgi:hypothetical protein